MNRRSLRPRYVAERRRKYAVSKGSYMVRPVLAHFRMAGLDAYGSAADSYPSFDPNFPIVDG